jgi:hypothetical protein
MPVPTAIADLSTTAADNSPAGADSVFTNLDNYLRAHAAFIATNRDAIAAFTAGTGFAALAGAEFTGPVSVSFETLTDAATVSTNALLGNNFIVTLAGNRVLANPTGLRDGGVYRFWIKQDATGSRTLSYGTYFKWAGGTAPTLSTGASKLDVITAQYNSALAILHCTYSLDVR